MSRSNSAPVGLGGFFLTSTVFDFLAIHPKTRVELRLTDDTLNLAGKRIGPAELESAAVAHPAVAEAAAVGVPHEVKGESAWIFCVLKPGAEADGDGVAEQVGTALGKAFKPERVLFVSALPKTRSAKIVRRAVRAAVLGQELGDLSSVENPEALDEIERLLAAADS